MSVPKLRTHICKLRMYVRKLRTKFSADGNKKKNITVKTCLFKKTLKKFVYIAEKPYFCNDKCVQPYRKPRIRRAHKMLKHNIYT